MGKNNSKLKPKDLKDLKKETLFTEDEIENWYSDFKNNYPTGYIDISEFKDIYANLYPHGDADEFARSSFRVFDSNNDGKINFREFLTALSITSRGNLIQKLNWVFSMYDIDGNGQISRNEMLEIIGAIYKMAGEISETSEQKLYVAERVDEIFGKLDKDSDGFLTLEEFVDGAQSDPFLWELLAHDMSDPATKCK